ncbi:MAG TPA: NUDIX domain-containing protein, partial [Candidatus Saccharimonadales bacterium]|nr:NUDIX domain-containing protein [Candidatus Saccharimonadales bacterium]
MVQNAERLVGPPKPEAVNIARGICVAPVPIADITSQIRAGIPISQINFSEALLIRKSSKSKVSSGLVMPVGGNLQKNETSLEGALREVGEEVTFVSLDEKSVRTYPNFVYRIPGYDKRRNMEFLFHPVQSKDVSLHTAREGFNGGEDKIAEVLSFSRDELRELTEKGSIQRNDEEIKAASHFTFADTEPQIEEQRGGLREAWRRSKLRLVNGLRTGHFTIADAEPIMSEQDHDKKVEALNGINRDFERFEGRLKKSTLSAVNRLRRIKGEERLTTLDDCSIDEIEVGFIAAQMHMAFADSKKRERTDGAYPPAKADLLKVIPYFAALPPSRMPDLLLLAPTKEITNGLETLEKGFDSGVGVIIEGLELDNVQRSVLSDMSSIDALKFVWLEFRSLDLSDRISLLRQAERATIEGFIDNDAGIVESDVLDAKKTMDEFHDFITSELQSQASLDIPIFQEHRPMDDILNAGIFTHMVYSLGLHPHANIEPNVGDPSSADILQFEALRNLAVFSVGLEAAKMLRGASNDTFQASMDDFFELPSDREVIDLGDGRIHNVYHRVDPDSGMH